MKEVHEMTSKLVETIAAIAGSRLEAETWLSGSVQTQEILRIMKQHLNYMSKVQLLPTPQLH